MHRSKLLHSSFSALTEVHVNYEILASGRTQKRHASSGTYKTEVIIPHFKLALRPALPHFLQLIRIKNVALGYSLPLPPFHTQRVAEL